MIVFSGRGILLDVEGTPSSIQFVYDVLFPYARRELQEFVLAKWGTPEVAEACAQIARDAGADSLESWCRQRPDLEPPEAVCAHVVQLMNGDAKATGLKQLQGVIWRSGFESGELRAHVFEDVPPALEQWSAAGIDLRIYSSGSVAAQRLFFGHTICGDLTPCLRGHYDTTTGPKKDPASYTAIAKDMRLEPHEILFLSDVGDELDRRMMVADRQTR